MCIALAGAPLASSVHAQQNVEIDLTLQHAEELLLAADHDLLAIRLAARAAHADVITAGEAPNPQLSFNSSGGNIKTGIGTGYPWDKRLDSVLRIDQPLERGGKRGLRVKAASSAAAAADLDINDVLRTAKQSLTASYYDLKYAQEAEESYSSLLDFERQSLTAAESRQHAGDASAIDVARLRIEAARAESDWLHAKQATRQAQIALAELLGLGDSSEQLHAGDEWPTLVAAHAADTSNVIDFVSKRPDVQAAQQRANAATRNLELAQAQRTRDVTVGVQYEHDLTLGPVVNSWGVGVSVPLFVRNRYEGEIARAHADRDSAAEALEHIKLNAQLEIEQANADLSFATQRMKKYQSEVVDDARASSEAAEYAYQRGALGLTDLLDARRAYQAVKLDSLDAHNAYAKALAEWRAATTTVSVAGD